MRPCDAKQILHEYKNRGCTFLVVILPNGTDTYATIKQTGNVELGNVYVIPPKD